MVARPSWAGVRKYPGSTTQLGEKTSISAAPVFPPVDWTISNRSRRARERHPGDPPVDVGYPPGKARTVVRPSTIDRESPGDG